MSVHIHFIGQCWFAYVSNSDGNFQSGDAEVDAEEAIFLELIQTLLKEPAEREHFYQVSKLYTHGHFTFFLGDLLFYAAFLFFFCFALL